ncbi:thioesterase II family protein [Streptomyces sp. NPDC006463]|uniref:thioesterase II family protein n=1 Tax=Streptomyces sp. NPDC006463 TaxID=3364746 RepID=UPI00368EE98D
MTGNDVGTDGRDGLRPVDSAWFRIPPARGEGGRVRLFCLPQAGGGTSGFQQWPRVAPGWLEIVPIRLPGREARFDEPLPTDFASVVRQIADAIGRLAQDEAARGRRPVPYALFGHSMGGWLAYETALCLSQTAARQASRVFISGIDGLDHAAVRVAETMDPRYIAEVLGTLSGPAAQLVARPALAEVFASAVASDLAMLRTYTPAFRKVNCPLTVLWSPDDPRTDRDGIRNWEKWTEGAFEVLEFSGGHGFPFESGEAAVAALAARLEPADGIAV